MLASAEQHAAAVMFLHKVKSPRASFIIPPANVKILYTQGLYRLEEKGFFYKIPLIVEKASESDYGYNFCSSQTERG